MRIFVNILKCSAVVMLTFIVLVLLIAIGLFVAYKIWIGRAPALPEEPVVHSHNDPSEGGTLYASQQELITAMGMGWNAGNALDMPAGKNIYTQPILQPELFTSIKELGFDSIRIPVTWHHYVSDAPEYKIEPERMARVRQVVDQALDAGLIVIINSHHDNSMYTPTQENADNAVNFVEKIWSQVAEEFKDYDNNLIFESMNEPVINDSEHMWAYDPNCTECCLKAKVTARANQAFVNAVRNAGGRNDSRYLILKCVAPIPTISVTLHRTLPKDSAEKRLLVGVQEYCPNELCLFGDMSINEYNDYTENLLAERMDMLYNAFVKKGIHVVYCEMGITNKNNPEDRYKWHKFHISEAKKRGIACFVWDNGNTQPGGESFGIVSKKTGKVYKESISAFNGMMEGIGKTEKVIPTDKQ